GPRVRRHLPPRDRWRSPPPSRLPARGHSSCGSLVHLAYSRRLQRSCLMRRSLRGPTAAVLLACGGCLPSGLETHDEAPQAGKVQVRFLGVGGYLIRRNDDVIMTAPLYSSPTRGAMFNGTTPPHDDVIDAFAKPPNAAHHVTAQDLADLRA